MQQNVFLPAHFTTEITKKSESEYMKFHIQPMIFHVRPPIQIKHQISQSPMVRTSRYPFLARQSYSFSFFLTSSKQTLDAWCSLVVRHMYYASQNIRKTFSDIMELHACSIRGVFVI